MPNKPDEQRKQQGINEARQDHKQDEVAKQRPGQADEKIRDEQSRGPRGGASPGR